MPSSDAFSKNFIDYEEYPVSADIQNRTYAKTSKRLFWHRLSCIQDVSP